MNRLQANRQIIQTLAALVECYPDMRFHQLLVNADVLKTEARPGGSPEVVNEYHVESEVVLERVKKSSLMEVQYERS